MAILRSVSWTATGQVVRQGIQFLLAIVLARLLTPADFGLLALVTVFTGFASMFSDFGMSSAVIYRQDVSPAELDFAFWLNIAVGLLATALCVAVAPLVGAFYSEPRVIPLMRTVALTFAIGSFGILPHSLLQKAFRFRALAVVDISTATVAGVVAVFVALRGFGVWSLVAQSLATTLAAAVLKWLLVRWKPGFRFRWRDGAALWRFGTNLLGFNVLNYWCRNGDNLLIGRFCGAVELGLYSRAYSLMLLPVSQVHIVLSSVMFPTLAKMQNSKEAFRRSYLLACQAIALIAFPVMLGLLVEADDIIHVLWGPRWIGIVPIIRVLAIAGLGNAIGTTVGWVYTATGRTDLMFRWSLISAPVMLASFAAGLRWGAYGVAIGYTTVLYVLLWYPMWIIPGRLIGLSFRAAMTNLLKPFLAAALAGSCTLVARKAVLPADTSALARLAILGALGTLVYLGAVRKLKIPAVRELRSRMSSHTNGRFHTSGKRETTLVERGAESSADSAPLKLAMALRSAPDRSGEFSLSATNMFQQITQRVLANFKRLQLCGPILKSAAVALHRKRYRSASYWERRYSAGGNSGSGSYGELAEFKAEVLNAFVREHGIRSVIELGCGDGNQLSLAEYPEYTGLDIAPSAVALCRKRFAHDPTKRFAVCDSSRPALGPRAELALSLDVIFHLTEDNAFDAYMRSLFEAATRFVIIYSDDSDAHGQSVETALHVRHRKFSRWIAANFPAWQCVQRIPNRYPSANASGGGSWCDFWVYALPGIDPEP